MECISWGKSMYGGWYIEYIEGSKKVSGERFLKLSDLRAFAKSRGVKLVSEKRFDNI